VTHLKLAIVGANNRKVMVLVPKDGTSFKEDIDIGKTICRTVAGDFFYVVESIEVIWKMLQESNNISKESGNERNIRR
jgi:hypothetical protein